MSKKIALFNWKPKKEPQKCPVYLKLPWIGKISLKFEKQTKIAINRCYQAVESRIIFTTRKILPAVHKNVPPSLQQSMVVYQCVCRCDWIGTWIELPKDCKTELINTFRDALEVTKNQRKICLIENIKSLAPRGARRGGQGEHLPPLEIGMSCIFYA